MDRKIYQEQYDSELNQRNHLASTVNVPIVAATVLGGALSSMLLRFTFKIDAVSISFVIISIISALFLGMSVFLIFRSLIGYEYEKIAPPSALKTHYNKLKEWHEKNPNSEGDEKIDFDEFLYTRMGEAVEINSKNNIDRGNYLHMATIAIAIATVFLAMSGGLYIFNKLDNGASTHKVKIIGTVKLDRR